MKAMSVRAPRNGVKATPSADHSTRQRFDRAVRQLTTSRTSVVSGQQWAPLGWRRESPRVTGPTEEVSLNMTTVGCLQVRELAKRFDRCRTLLEHGHERGPSRRAERASDLGGDTGNRTPDLLLAKQALYQLSYVPEGMFSSAARW